MRNRGFQWFIVIAGGLLLALNLWLAIRLRDDAAARPLPLYAGIYAIYLVMFVRMELRRRREKGEKKPKSPLMK